MPGFTWAQPVPPSWQTDLDRLAPGENVSRLVLHWLAGTPDHPAQRWAIWETLPRPLVAKILEEDRRRLGEGQSFAAVVWNAVQGPDPRTVGHWIKRQGKPVWHSKSLVSREQWDIHQQTGGLPFLSWIIEGHGGGHSWQCGPFEQSFLMAAGVEPDVLQELQAAWPVPGSQPYADYDQRVFHALAERDLLRQWRQSLAWDDRSARSTAGLILEGEAARRREDMLQRTLRWLDNQIGDAVSDIPRKLLPQWSQFQPVDQAADEEAVHLQVVKDGQLKDYRAAQGVGG